MDDYISRDIILKRIKTIKKYWSKYGLTDFVQSIPSADVVEVVRCKDCKYAHLTYDGHAKYCDMWKDDEDNFLELYLDRDFFCADGERKDNE